MDLKPVITGLHLVQLLALSPMLYPNRPPKQKRELRKILASS